MKATIFTSNVKLLFKVCCPLYKHIGVHSFRRGGASEKITQGVCRDVVQQQLGYWQSGKSLDGYLDQRCNTATCISELRKFKKWHTLLFQITLHPNTNYRYFQFECCVLINKSGMRGGAGSFLLTPDPSDSCLGWREELHQPRFCSPCATLPTNMNAIVVEKKR